MGLSVRSGLGKVTIAALAAGALAVPLTAVTASAAAPLAPLAKASGSVIPGQYIVVLKSGAVSSSAPAVLTSLHRTDRVSREFHGALRGFTAELTSTLLRTVRTDPQVAYVEQDQIVRTQATESPATWGLDRIDQRALPLNNAYTYSRTGAGVNAYIIDTGIRATHKDLGGRVSGGYTAISDGKGTSDCNGHGTHVSGTVGSATYGVAKQVHLIPVRVLGCDGSGSNSGVIAGINWVTTHRVLPAVANMSLGGSTSTALDDAVKASIAAGVTYSIAAGNSSLPACLSSPARVPTAITVGATQKNDQTAGFSNWGDCIDLFAPGVDITSDWATSDTATNTISGTSMATPHVTGVAALYLQGHPSASPAAVSKALVAAATPNVLSWAVFGSPNKLLSSSVG